MHTEIKELESLNYRTNNFPKLEEIYHDNGKFYKVKKQFNSCENCCFKNW